MKIKLSKSQWDAIGKKAAWNDAPTGGSLYQLERIDYDNLNHIARNLKERAEFYESTPENVNAEAIIKYLNFVSKKLRDILNGVSSEKQHG